MPVAGAVIGVGGLVLVGIAWRPKRIPEQVPIAAKISPEELAITEAGHRITVNIGPGGLEMNPRSLLLDRVANSIREGERILRFPQIDRTVEEAPVWQRATYDLLDTALVDPMQAQLFDRMGVPIPDCPPNVGLNQRIGNQVNFLVNLLERLDTVEISGTWLP